MKTLFTLPVDGHNVVHCALNDALEILRRQVRGLLTMGNQARVGLLNQQIQHGLVRVRETVAPSVALFLPVRGILPNGLFSTCRWRFYFLFLMDLKPVLVYFKVLRSLSEQKVVKFTEFMGENLKSTPRSE